MQVISFWPVSEYGSPTIGYFDIQVTDGLRLCGMRLIKQRGSGEYRIIAPPVGNRRAVTFHPSVASKITRAVLAHIDQQSPNAQHAA